MFNVEINSCFVILLFLLYESYCYSIFDRSLWQCTSSRYWRTSVPPTPGTEGQSKYHVVYCYHGNTDDITHLLCMYN